jgi:hypothetical protein
LIVIAAVILMAASCVAAPDSEDYERDLTALQIGDGPGFQVLQIVPQRQQSADLALVAHAAAAVEGWQGSNALEALENAVTLGFRYIELDMLYTTDGKIVLNHNWYHVSNRIPGIENGIMSHAEFMSHRIFGQFTPVDLDLLINFLRENPGPRIITDTKDTDYAALYAIAEFFPEYKYRFIPQAYTFEDVARIRALGFKDIILTIYMMELEGRDPGFIHEFAMEEGLYAVAMPESWAIPAFVAYLDMDEMRYMAHTIDSAEKANVLHAMGFYAIYTGFLAYDSNGGIVAVPLPLRDYLDKIEHNLQYELNEEQKYLAQFAVFNKIGVPVNVHELEVVPVRADVMSAPFISPITELVYLPARHFERYTRTMDWRPDTRILHIATEHRAHNVRGANHELFLYRDMLFISEDVLGHVFGFEVLIKGDYVVVIVEDIGKDVIDEDFFEIAEILFAE